MLIAIPIYEQIQLQNLNDIVNKSNNFENEIPFRQLQLNSLFEINGKSVPEHWGEPPKVGTFDLRELPGGYGFGSSTEANLIQQYLDKDATEQENELI